MGLKICINHQHPFGTIEIYLLSHTLKHHCWFTGITGLLYPQIFVHHYKENHTCIRYIHLDPPHPYMDPFHILFYNILSNFSGYPCFPWGPTTSTISHAALQTLGVMCGPLHSTHSHLVKFKDILKTLYEILEGLSELI